MKIQIQGGTIIDPAAGTEERKDLFIAAGRIVGIGEAPADFHAVYRPERWVTLRTNGSSEVDYGLG